MRNLRTTRQLTAIITHPSVFEALGVGQDDVLRGRIRDADRRQVVAFNVTDKLDIVKLLR